MCGEGIGCGSVALSTGCLTASRALVEDRLAVLGCDLPLAMTVSTLFLQTVTQSLTESTESYGCISCKSTSLMLSQ
jgi:hypothetical protein